ncbi:MAG: tyrosine-type recombinase/integrase, partial [Alphaproteobacteria bacterium]
PLPKVLSAEEALRLLEAARVSKVEDGEDKPERARLIGIVEILYSSGLRISELVSLPLSAIRKDQRFIHVVGKGGRERLAPL